MQKAFADNVSGGFDEVSASEAKASEPFEKFPEMLWKVKRSRTIAQPLSRAALESELFSPALSFALQEKCCTTKACCRRKTETLFSHRAAFLPVGLVLKAMRLKATLSFLIRDKVLQKSNV